MLAIGPIDHPLHGSVPPDLNWQRLESALRLWSLISAPGHILGV
jgi:hypothetical protein